MPQTSCLLPSAHLEICTDHAPALMQDLGTAVRVPNGNQSQRMLICKRSFDWRPRAKAPKALAWRSSAAWSGGSSPHPQLHSRGGWSPHSWSDRMLRWLGVSEVLTAAMSKITSALQLMSVLNSMAHASSELPQFQQTRHCRCWGKKIKG